jgi:hypothetical protein
MLLSRACWSPGCVSGRQFVVRGHEPVKTITGPGKDFKTDDIQHAVIFVDNAGDPLHQRIAALACSRVIDLDEALAKFALDPLEMLDRKLPVSGPRDERSNETDLPQMSGKRTIGLAAAQPLKIQSCAQYESRGFFPGHGEQQRLEASRGLAVRCGFLLGIAVSGAFGFRCDPGAVVPVSRERRAGLNMGEFCRPFSFAPGELFPRLPHPSDLVAVQADRGRRHGRIAKVVTHGVRWHWHARFACVKSFDR